MKKIYLLVLICFCSLAKAHEPKVSVNVPASYTTETSKTYPVIYLLDGELNQSMLIGMLERLYLSNGAFEHIVVSIDADDRLYDFAPTINKDPRGPVGSGGGGDKLLDYLEVEVMPGINKEYRTTGFNTIMGHSLGGLLVMHSFHSRPKLFQSHLAFSPALWWGARETAIAAKSYVLSKKASETYLYMNIGSEGGEMRSVFDSLATTIAENRSTELTLQLDEFDDSSHNFTMAAGLYNALAGLYHYQRRRGI